MIWFHVIEWRPSFPLERLLDAAPFIAVFFHDDDCAECEAILESLEQVAA